MNTIEHLRGRSKEWNLILLQDTKVPFRGFRGKAHEGVTSYQTINRLRLNNKLKEYY